MRYVFFISDKTGITTEALGNTLLTQFPDMTFKKELIPFVDSMFKAEQAIIKINNQYLYAHLRPIILTTIINPEIRQKFKLTYCFHLDFFETFLPSLENELGKPASHLIGKSHGISDANTYSKRINSIYYALYNDDGVTIKNLNEADVILIGVSRVGKTPTCLYLAVNYGIKAANYPLVELDLEIDKLPKNLVPFHNKLFGLTIDAEQLHYIRTHRLPNTKYADITTCQYEIQTAEKIMHLYDIPYINTSKRSIEEIAVGIMQRIDLHRKF